MDFKDIAIVLPLQEAAIIFRQFGGQHWLTTVLLYVFLLLV